MKTVRMVELSEEVINFIKEIARETNILGLGHMPVEDVLFEKRNDGTYNVVIRHAEPTYIKKDN